MIFQWFPIFNKDEFDALELVSKTYTWDLTGIGEVDVLVTKGVGYGITYDGVFLSLNLNDEDPFIMDGYAIYMDSDNMVYLGFEVEQ